MRTSFQQLHIKTGLSLQILFENFCVLIIKQVLVIFFGKIFGMAAMLLLYEHFNDHLILSCNRYFDGIIQTVSFWDIK